MCSRIKKLNGRLPIYTRYIYEKKMKNKISHIRY